MLKTLETKTPPLSTGIGLITVLLHETEHSHDGDGFELMEGLKLGLVLGFDEGLLLGRDDGFELMEGLKLGLLDGLAEIEGIRLGRDDGFELMEGLKLGLVDGLADTDGIKLGREDGFELMEGLKLGVLLGLQVKSTSTGQVPLVPVQYSGWSQTRVALRQTVPLSGKRQYEKRY